MPGQLVHTGEVMVLLGDNYFALRSSQQAAAVVQRRIDVIKDLISTVEKKAADIAARSHFSEQAKNALQRTMGQQASSEPRGDEGGTKDKKGWQGGEGGEGQTKPPRRVPIDEEDDSEDEDDEDDEDDDEGQASAFGPIDDVHALASCAQACPWLCLP